MAKAIHYRSDNTYMISQDSTDNPKLGAKVLNDGRVSLYLDYYFGYQKIIDEKTGKEKIKKDRKREFLKLYLWQAPRTPQERQQNKETLEIAKKIRFEKGQQMLENSEGYRLKKKEEDINFLNWMWEYYEKYTKGDKRHIKRAHDVFIDFLIDPKDEFTPKPDWTREQRKEAATKKVKKAKGLKIKPEQITKDKVVAFTEYLQRRFKGEGAHTLFARFKKVIKAAVEADIILKNPCNGVIIKIDNGALKKDILSQEEIDTLWNTHYEGESQEIRKGFMFCLYSGMRFCDVVELKYSNIDYSNRLIKYEQAKTKGHSSASHVVLPLSDPLLKLVGQPGEGQTRDSIIFNLPTHNMCLKALRHWTKRAGIEKHITWHCARHSFAVNVLNNGANIKTVSSLLGHSGLKHTEKYTRAIDSLKVEAINSLPDFEL